MRVRAMRLTSVANAISKLFGMASLDLDFTTGVLDPRITFSRASTGTYFDNTGTLVSAPVNYIRNNTMVGAVAGTPGTLPTNWIRGTSGTATTQVVGMGVESNINYIDVRFVASSASAVVVQQEGNQAVTAASGQAFTASSYLRVVGGSLSGISSVSLSISERDSLGAALVATDTSVLTVNANSLSSQRFTCTRTCNNASTAFTTMGVALNTSGAIDITLRIGLPQLEPGSVATSPIKTSGIIASVPRFEYDSVTLAAKGLWIEEQRTNLAIRSSAIDSSLYPTIWQFAQGASLWFPSATINAPDGTASGKTYTVTAGAAAHTGYQAFTPVTASTTYSWSIYVKLGTLPLSDYFIAVRDDTNGVFIVQDLRPTLVAVKNGWARLIYTFTTPVGCVALRCYPIRSTTIVTGGTVSFWGGQLEPGSLATSYIYTTTAQATRAADIAVMTGTNFSSWYNQTEGTFFAEYVANGPRIDSGFTFSVIADSNNYLGFSYQVANDAVSSYWKSGGVNTILTTANRPFKTLRKYAAAYKSGSFSATTDGDAVVSVIPTSPPPLVGELRFAQRGGASDFSTSIHIKRLTYFPRRLSNDELRRLTA